MIDVQAIDDDRFEVSVEEADGTTKHTVTVDDEYYEKLTGGQISKEELLERSFEFLLAREPKESILAQFTLQTITRYFPSYEEEISV